MTPAEKLKAKLQEQRAKTENRGQNNSGAKRTGDGASFPFWNLNFNQSVDVRFIADANPDNDFFWVNKEVIKLPFQGIVGGEYPTQKEVVVNVPCVSMFGMQCPITNHIRPWWKDGREDLARKYYRKRSYIFQGFVVGNNPVETEVPENPIRRFVVNQSIFKIIEPALANGMFEDLPCDYVGGRDFTINKTKQGEWANYGTSTWKFQTRSLGDAELAAIEQYGHFDLREAQGRIPDSDELAAIEAMFQASLNGDPFDTDSFGKWYRAFGGDNGGGNYGGAAGGSTGGAAAQTNNSVADRFTNAEPASAPQQEAPQFAAGGGKPNAADLFEAIRNRALNTN